MLTTLFRACTQKRGRKGKKPVGEKLKWARPFLGSQAHGGSNPPPSAMEINDFARMNHERAVRNDHTKVFNWEYFAIAMAGECGEILNNAKKIRRGDFPLNKEAMAEEVADAVTYAFLLLSELGVDPE